MDKLKKFKNLRQPIKLSGVERKKESDGAVEDTFYNPGLYNLEEEYKRYNQMLQEGIEDRSVFFRIGRINHFWGNLDMAKDYYKRSLSIDPEDGECHYNLGNIYFKQGNFEDAKKEFQIAIKANSQDVYSLNAMGKACFRLGEFEEAEKCHNMALKINSDDVYALRGLGDISIAKKDYSEALNCYHTALEVNPHDNLTLHNIGLAFILNGEIEKAEEHYNDCILKDNKFPGFYTGIAFCDMKRNKKESAFENYKKGMALIRKYSDYVSFAEYDEISDLGIGELKEMKESILGKYIIFESPLDTVKMKSERSRKKPESVMAFMAVDLISLEVGRGLLSFVDRNQGAKLLDRITSIRRHLAMEMGIVVPGIRFRDNQQLKPNMYVIKIKDVEVASGEIIIDRYMAIAPEDNLKNLEGPICSDPTYGMPAVWITAEQREKADKLGAMIFDPITVIATQITEVIRCNAVDLLGRQETLAFLERLRKTHSAVVDEIYPRLFSLGEIHMILQNLLKEKVSIRDLVTILETIGNYSNITKDLYKLTEYVREALSRAICRQYQNKDGVITVIKLDRELENYVLEALRRYERNPCYAMNPAGEEILLNLIGKEIETLTEKAIEPIVLCSPYIRLYLRKLTEKSFPHLVVLSCREIAHNVKINAISTVKLSSCETVFEKDQKFSCKKDIFKYISELQKDKDPGVRSEAVKMLLPLSGLYKSEIIFNYLDKALMDEAPGVRLDAARVMRDLIEKYAGG